MNKNVLVQLNVKATSRDDALMQISTFAFKNRIIENEDDIKLLYDSFVKRENDSTTAFENGFAIPHARIDAIKIPTIIISKFEEKINNWLTIDNSNVQITIALLIPKNAGTTHIEILSKIATLLLNNQFRQNLKNLNNEHQIKNYVLEQLDKEKETPRKQFNNSNNIKIVGVSACATGVAHTYMAKEALEKAGVELGWNVKIETQGQKGIEFKLSEDEINQADAVVFATDIYVDPERFSNKKFLKVNTNDAIHNAKNVLQESLKQKSNNNHNNNGGGSKRPEGAAQFKNPVIKVFMGHLLSGVSRMIPFIVFSGILWAIFNSIGSSNPGLVNNDAFKIAKEITEIGFGVFIAMMGGFIAESIAGRAGLAPGFICTFAAANSKFTFWWNINGIKGIPQIDSFFPNVQVSNVGLSLFAAIIMGFSAGYLVKWVLTWKTHKLITPIIPIIFIPVVCTSVIVFPFIFLLSGPLGYLMNGLVFGISEAGQIPGLNFFIGCLLGAMIGFDMGGPINKIAGTTATALITVDPRLMGAVATAIPIAPLGCGLATLIGRRLFSMKERAEGITALGLGFFGISEGAIPFAVNNPKKVLIANVIGSSIAGGLSFLFFVGGYVGMWGGPITAFVLGVKTPIEELSKLNTAIPSIFGGSGQGMEFISILWFFLAIAVGTTIHAFLFIFMIKLDNKDEQSAFAIKIRNFRKKLSPKKSFKRNIRQKFVRKFQVYI